MKKGAARLRSALLCHARASGRVWQKCSRQRFVTITAPIDGGVNEVRGVCQAVYLPALEQTSFIEVAAANEMLAVATRGLHFLEFLPCAYQFL